MDICYLDGYSKTTFVTVNRISVQKIFLFARLIQKQHLLLLILAK